MPDPFPLQHVPEIGSTSEVLRHRAEAGEAEQALMADRQTAGRGRLGRAWVSPPGNLHLSVLLRPAPPIHPGHWSLLAAVCVAEVVEGIAPGAGAVRLKWPNDLMLGGGKLAGILLELGVDASPWLVIGIGLNLVAAPASLGRATASLAGEVAPAVAAARVLSALAAWRGRYEAGGFAPIRAAWMARGPERGAILVTGGVTGSYDGIGEDGALLLRVGDGVVAIVSGEVS